MPQSRYPFAVTCETHDEAVMHCLNALSVFAEYHAAGSEAPGMVAPSETTMLGEAARWGREDGRVTFRFSDPRRRGTFLGEATRLLSGKWTRVELLDEQEAQAGSSAP